MKQQTYFIRPPADLSSCHSVNKNSFTNKVETSNSQGVRRKTPIISQPLHSPVHLKDLYRNQIAKGTSINHPLPEGSISKFKIINDFSGYKMPTARRMKSDEQVATPKQIKKTQNNHMNNIKFRTDRKPNYTPVVKMKTEPNDVCAHSISKKDESQEILFRLHKKSIPTEPDDKVSQILGNQLTRCIKKVNSIDNSNPFFIRIEQDSQFLQETKEKKQILHQNNSQTKEQILDLLCLSTQDLKRKFAELNKVGNSKINTRQSNKLLIPKTGRTKFPTDFFNALQPNSILH
ncbi:unnamed protein product (macronuclear) [Paramecium tetraurelia]|uniref:Uncharacterized protein n=1 Tax=Paramecium tetraurelia TaxID=5888 RepID=A0BF09_PARTE|nr:uncharacterized protein GSPATT00028161001 [Paramecium tetraurelia]CAK57126.1 unnamed protein product [Paramecium tetraurelia]|eukprot:XP_001424524.1 hypothetical protein (macronuclear) [Paramecium tetraurelia strain d4-2]